MVRELEDLNGRTAFRLKPFHILEQDLEKPLVVPSDSPLRASPPTAATKINGALDGRRSAEATGDLRQVRL
jgi:hypothetical protein